MSLPPLPLSYETNSAVGRHEGSGLVFLVDATGRKVGVLWGTPDEKLALAEMIVEAADRVHAFNKGERS